jgi:hypothetical protein
MPFNHRLYEITPCSVAHASRRCVVRKEQLSFQVKLHPDGSLQGEQDALIEAPARVLVYCKDKGTVQCTMQRPAEQYAACNCETAQQQKICHHQMHAMAYLPQCSLDVKVESNTMGKSRLNRKFLEGTRRDYTLQRDHPNSLYVYVHMCTLEVSSTCR